MDSTGGAIDLRLARIAVVVIVIITAVPAGLRDPTTMCWRLLLRPGDALANVLLYMPLGLFLQAHTTLLSVTGLTAALSSVIEVTQLFFVRRNPQPLDVFSNVLGAVFGAVAGKYFKIRSDRVELGTTLGISAIAAAAIWTAGYFLMSGSLPPFVGRGTIAGVSFLVATGFTGIFKPQRRYSRVGASLLGGLIGGAILLPVSPVSVPITFTIAALFGIALIMVSDARRTELFPRRNA